MEFTSELTKKIEVKFVYSRHGVEDGPKVWEILKYSDIILVELYGQKVTDITNAEDRINRAAKLRNITSRRMFAESLEENGEAAPYIARNVIITGKELHFIDIRENGPGFDEDANATKQEDLCKKVFFRDCKPYSAFKHFRFAVRLTAESIKKRDQYVSKQIKDLIDSNQEWSGKRIGVFQGTSHKETYRHFKKDHPNSNSITRTFIDGRVAFNLEIEFRNRLGQSVNKDDLQEFVKRYYLSRFIIKFGLLDRGYPNNEDTDNITDKISKLMTTTEVASTFKSLKELEEFLLMDKANSFKEEYLREKIIDICANIVEKYYTG